MNQDTRTEGGRPELRCLACAKPIGPGERSWRVHFRGTDHVVCCPSCAQVFNRSPRQFVEEP